MSVLIPTHENKNLPYSQRADLATAGEENQDGSAARSVFAAERRQKRGRPKGIKKKDGDATSTAQILEARPDGHACGSCEVCRARKKPKQAKEGQARLHE